MKSFVADCLLLTANISASRRVLYCMLLVVSTWSSWPLMVGEYPEGTSRKAIIFQKLELRLSSWKHCYLPKLLMLTSGNRGEHWHNFICSVWQIVTSQKLWVLSRWDKGLVVGEFCNVALVHCHSFMQFFSRAEVWTLTGPLQPWFFSFLTCTFTTVVGMTVLLHDPAVWWPHIWL